MPTSHYSKLHLFSLSRPLSGPPPPSARSVCLFGCSREPAPMKTEDGNGKKWRGIMRQIPLTLPWLHCACSNSVNFTHYGTLKAHSDRENGGAEASGGWWCAEAGTCLRSAIIWRQRYRLRGRKATVVKSSSTRKWIPPLLEHPSDFRTIINERWIKLKLCFSWSEWWSRRAPEYSSSALDETKWFSHFVHDAEFFNQISATLLIRKEYFNSVSPLVWRGCH